MSHEDGNCKRCDVSCRECVRKNIFFSQILIFTILFICVLKIGDAKYCISCKNDRKLYNNECVPKCPDNTYENNEICYSCHDLCGTCEGPSENSCISCNSKYKGLIFKDKTCSKFHFMDYIF